MTCYVKARKPRVLWRKSPVRAAAAAAGKEDKNMAKGKTTVYFCQECGYESAKWMGQCPACHEWNTFVEETVEKKSARGSRSADSSREAKAVPLSQIEMTQEQRVSTGMKELDRVLGGRDPWCLWAEIRESENRRCFCRYAGILRNIR